MYLAEAVTAVAAVQVADTPAVVKAVVAVLAEEDTLVAVTAEAAVAAVEEAHLPEAAEEPADNKKSGHSTTFLCLMPMPSSFL